jgi:hypothetical protein
LAPRGQVKMSNLSQNFHALHIPLTAHSGLFHTILTCLRLMNFNESLDITQIARYNKRNERRWCVMNEPCRCTGSIVISHTFQMRGSGGNADVCSLVGDKVIISCLCSVPQSDGIARLCLHSGIFVPNQFQKLLFETALSTMYLWFILLD